DVSLAALLAALALAAAPPALEPPAAPPPAGGQRTEILVRFPPWQFTGTFTLSAGGLVDRGVARDRGSIVGPAKTVERVLEGERGTLVLTLRAEVKGASFPPIFGRWQVARATGAYAGLFGGGTFTAVDGGSGQGGSPFEVQTLLGRVSRR
ncbi:MAG TPA: hypothetical protein VFP50_16055, partial [Anaeromyxobacteraceae bacterium]|nr:hypothetical protein [Anaeromyxobacteraceae bacterium]